MCNLCAMARVGTILVLLLLAGCAAGGDPGPSGKDPPERRELRVESLDSGAPFEGPRRPRVVVAPSAEALSKELGAGVRASGEGTYLAVQWGARPTGGYSIGVAGATVEGRRVTVRLALEAPPEDAIVAQVLTYPYAVSVLKDLDPAGKEFSLVDGKGETLDWPIRRVGG